MNAIGFKMQITEVRDVHLEAMVLAKFRELGLSSSNLEPWLEIQEPACLLTTLCLKVHNERCRRVYTLIEICQYTNTD